MALTLNKGRVSLPSEGKFQLIATPSDGVAWSTSNERIKVNTDGVITASRDCLRPEGQAIITATRGAETATCAVTIVNWPTNDIELEFIAGVLPSGYFMTKTRDGRFYYASGNKLYEYPSGVQICTFPDYPYMRAFIDTPFGYYMITQSCKVYRSYNLVDWELVFTPVAPSVDKSPLRHGVAWKYDDTTNTGYIFIGEYSVISTNRHRVYRITVNPDKTYSSDTILEFYSPTEYGGNNSLLPTARHIHVVATDPYTGDIWVGVGDSDYDSTIWYSKDNGQTWSNIGFTQENRALSIWFTDNYIYFNMDAPSFVQSIHRMKRTELASHTYPGNDKREIVATLQNGSQWYHCWAKDDLGRDFVIMGAAPEGQSRDWLGRLFGIWENPNGQNFACELYSVPSSNPDIYTGHEMTQLEPLFQDSDGYVYFTSRDTQLPGVWKMRLIRNTKSFGGKFTSPKKFIT